MRGSADQQDYPLKIPLIVDYLGFCDIIVFVGVSVDYGMQNNLNRRNS